MADPDPITVARFWSKVDVRGANECWRWLGTVVQPKGYGRFRSEKAHRVAYRLTKGEPSADSVIRHLCHVKLCCNPKHLAPGTPMDNAADDLAAGRTMRGARHGRCKLTDEQVLYIRASKARGIDLARELSVSESTISYIRSCGRRRHAGVKDGTAA